MGLQKEQYSEDHNQEPIDQPYNYYQTLAKLKHNKPKVEEKRKIDCIDDHFMPIKFNYF